MDVIQQSFAITAVLALLGGVVWFLKRKGLAYAANGLLRAKSRQSSLKSLERLRLTAQHSVHLVEIDGRRVLVGVHASGFTYLGGSAATFDFDKPGSDFREDADSQLRKSA
jgi:flagellar biogenesis protein FliO